MSLPTAALTDSSVARLGWLEGRWRGAYQGDLVEEHWMAPDGGGMVGMFRWVRSGDLRFSEILAVEPDGARVVLRIKHFDLGLKGWEDRDAAVPFDLVEAAASRAVFYRRGGRMPMWLIYERQPDGELWVWFEKEGDEGCPEDTFRFRPAPWPPPSD